MTFTIGDYLATRFEQIGIKNHFVVPGDYNLVLLDKLQANPKLDEINCCNELNCAFAAEGYARAKGVAACVVTFSVGAFSAFNGTGSAYGENLPLILVSGSPNTNDEDDHHLLHHTIGTHDFNYQYEMAKRITCAAVQVKHAVDAPKLIDYAIRSALIQKKPCYIEIPTNLSSAACAPPGPIHTITRRLPTDMETLENAVNAASKFINSKLKPTLLAGPLLKTADAIEAFQKLAEALGCAVAVMPSAKSLFPEDHKQFAGIYWGQVSTAKADAIMEWSDLTICAGCVFTDYSTTGWTALQPSSHRLEIEYDSVKFIGSFFNNVYLADFLNALADKVQFNDRSLEEYKRLRPDPVILEAADPGTTITRREMARQIQELITPDTTLFAETGDAWFDGIQTHFPKGARFEIEMQWGHIGWSVPACLGYATGAPERKIITLVGDGSFQMTAQEVSTMIRLKKPIIMFLINNYGYTIEVEIHDGPYNNIKNWDYAALVETFNADDGSAKGFHARTGGELAEAIKKAKANKNGPTLIEVHINRDDCTSELISWGHFVALANGRPPRQST